MTIVLNGTTGITTPTTSSTGEFVTSVTGFKNRIINGAMVIDQRNAGASVTPASNGFITDRFIYGSSQASKFTGQQVSTAPTGFINSLKMTVASAVTVGAGDYFYFGQKIEGLNVADLGWGTASAATVTLSFWVYSSLTGIFGGTLQNSSSTRSYPFTYTISSANTWEQKTVTIAGDTTGTWLTNNGAGIVLSFGLGVGSTYSGTAGTWAGANYVSATGATSVVGTNGATFYITGVQLEKGSTATSFDYRPYGTELALCQRYYETTAFPDVTFTNGATRAGIVFVGATGNSSGFNFLVPKRSNSPTVTLYSRNNTSGAVSLVTTGADVTGSTVSGISGTGFRATALGTGQTGGAGIETGWTASSEL